MGWNRRWKPHPSRCTCVLVERRSADALARPGEAGLSMFEASMAPSAPPAPTIVQLVDEDHRVLDSRIRHHGLSRLELAADSVPATTAEVERHDALVLEARHLSRHDALRQALRNRGPADAGPLMSTGLPLAPRQHLDDAPDSLAPDHGVYLPAGELRQVAAELVERLRPGALALGRRRSGRRATEELQRLLAHALPVDAQLSSTSARDALALRMRPSSRCSAPT